jgi:F0F1-type ATP synthase assembly protein I
LAAAVIAGTVLGLLLDRALGTEPVFTMAGVFLGILAGGLGFWARVHAALK